MGWVYAIIDSKSGRAYVGQTSREPRIRWNDHKRCAKSGKPHPLYRAMALRPEAFEFTIIAELPDELLGPVERDLVRAGPTLHPHGFNLQEGGLHSYKRSEELNARQRGKKASAETKAKLSEAHKGLKWAPGQREKMSAIMTGRKRSPEAIEKTRVAQIGKVISIEQRELLRAANLGKRHSAQTRLKMSRSHSAPELRLAAAARRLGGKLSVETKARMSAAHRTPEARAKSASSWLGKKMTLKTRRKMREAHARLRAEAKAKLDGLQTCSRCRQSLPSTREFFSPDKRAISGFACSCKSCIRRRRSPCQKDKSEFAWEPRSIVP